MIYPIAWVLWNILRAISFPLEVYGKENVPRHGAFILASNHLSYADPNIIGGCLPRRLSYMAKESLFRNNFFGFLLTQVGTLPVKRETGDIGAIKEALKRLKLGCPLVLFPEGTTMSVNKQNYPGVAFIAVKSGVPVVPVYVKGSDQVLPAGTKFFRRRPVSVTFGKPRVYSKENSYQEIADRIMREIQSANPFPLPASRI